MSMTIVGMSVVARTAAVSSVPGIETMNPSYFERRASLTAATENSPAPNVMIEGEMTFRAQMLDEFKPNGVVVWDTSEDTEASLWGGVMTATAMTKGIRGAVIAGGIRDTKQILEQKFPVFYKYRTSNGSLGRCMITHYQVPVRIGKVTVRPGDIIFGDIDGVLCIPREIAYDVLLRAEGIERNEIDIFSWVRQGDTISEIIDKGGYF